MVGLVVISHSSKIAEGIKEVALQMAPNALIECAGGTFDGEIGTDYNKIVNAIEKVYSKDGVIILFDLGSAVMNAEMAIENLNDKDKIKIVKCAVVEGAIAAAVEASIGNSLDEIVENLKALDINKA
ncbi:PTS-dependent dihydroxyacetone kinase phosphotransferase subunit DhaM [Caloramator sp. E03]|uniref:dihydroxyacetone kinase phosphoryl donor subunit DhaM n=1 Tax=Caloramator sp. E03 TaxID=2576307 RepID=UPI00111018F2|nr:dihydroxyacetone kinase phosphoryl donor subunit DhaM [Caloramator sp. E03]QCX33333.1 PTS-dependent dihydroxyacetone kinase phosphotransferase subunit DhaM [Caloramator sp. E03]